MTKMGTPICFQKGRQESTKTRAPFRHQKGANLPQKLGQQIAASRNSHQFTTTMGGAPNHHHEYEPMPSRVHPIKKLS